MGVLVLEIDTFLSFRTLLFICSGSEFHAVKVFDGVIVFDGLSELFLKCLSTEIFGKLSRALLLT